MAHSVEHVRKTLYTSWTQCAPIRMSFLLRVCVIEIIKSRIFQLDVPIITSLSA